jgi:hypothetical protein
LHLSLKIGFQPSLIFESKTFQPSLIFESKTGA